MTCFVYINCNLTPRGYKTYRARLRPYGAFLMKVHPPFPIRAILGAHYQEPAPCPA